MEASHRQPCLSLSAVHPLQPHRQVTCLAVEPNVELDQEHSTKALAIVGARISFPRGLTDSVSCLACTMELHEIAEYHFLSITIWTTAGLFSSQFGADVGAASAATDGIGAASTVTDGMGRD